MKFGIRLLENTVPFMSVINFKMYHFRVRGPGSSVGIATDYGLDGLGIECR
jgi:hypothetical protein